MGSELTYPRMVPLILTHRHLSSQVPPRLFDHGPIAMKRAQMASGLWTVRKWPYLFTGPDQIRARMPNPPLSEKFGIRGRMFLSRKGPRNSDAVFKKGFWAPIRLEKKGTCSLFWLHTGHSRPSMGQNFGAIRGTSVDRGA